MIIFKSRIIKYVGIFLSVILLPLIVSLIANYTTWFSTKDKVEVTLKLDGWITIGSVRFGDLPNLKLMLDSQPVENILKVSWLIINTGTKGINKFESGPFIIFPKGLNIIASKVSDKSPLLKISNKLILTVDRAEVDSLGIFNSGNYFRVDFYLKDVDVSTISNDYFNNWKLEGNSLDLKISKAISLPKEEARKSSIPRWFFYIYFIMIMIVMLQTLFKVRKIKEMRTGLLDINQLLKIKNNLIKASNSIDAVLKRQTKKKA